MSYPTLEQYNEALQNPKLHLLDAELKNGVVRTSGLGLPIAMCGGFALTYTVTYGPKKFAVRCFHKESAELEHRYAVISKHVKSLPGEYFLPFEFIPDGIRIKGNHYPVVKMAWATGETLSEFMEREYANPSALHRLRASLGKLSEFLEKENIAHGDIQPGNLMVADNGAKIQLIDYDGMYVAELKGKPSTELGQVNFQHPQRTETVFNEKLDRFSFILLDVALEALANDPQLWKRSQSDPDSIVFRRSDLLNPASSPVFKDVIAIKNMAESARNLAKVASGSIDAVPSLLDFLQHRNIPATSISFVQTSAVTRAPYQGAYPVLNATDFTAFVREIGSRVELIGKIIAVSRNKTRHGKPYVFVNFADWKGKAVKLNIWSEGLAALGTDAPDESWIGRWVAVSGLVEPVYQNPKYGYQHVSMTIDRTGQLKSITQDEAQYRLGNRTPQNGPGKIETAKNAKILSQMGARANTQGQQSGQNYAPATSQISTGSANLDILRKMQIQTQAHNTARPQSHPSPTSQGQSVNNTSGLSLSSIIVGIVILWLIIAIVR